MSDQKKLSDTQYAQMQQLLPLPSNHLKIPHRQVLDAWLYVLYQSCTWRGLAREFGDWHTIYVRLNRWAKKGVLERVAAELQRDALADMNLDTLALDSTIVNCHAHGTGAPQKRGTRPSTGRVACPRLERGRPVTCKLHVVAAGERTQLALPLSSGQAADGPGGRGLLRARAGFRPADPTDGPRLRRGLHATARHKARIGPDRPANTNRHRPRAYDPRRYQGRNKIARLFGRLKRFPRIVTR